MQKKTFLILLVTSFSAMLGIGIISPFLPRFAEQHGANGFWLGMIFAGFGISRALVVPLIGKVSDRVGRKIFVISGLLLYTILSLFYPIARGVVELTIVRLFHGLALGMIIPIVLAYVADLAPPGKESVTLSAMNTMFYIGLATGPLLGGSIDQSFGFNAVFYVISALGGLNFLVVLAILPDSRPHETEKSETTATFSGLIHYNFIKAVLIIAVLVTVMMTVFISFVPSLAEKLDINTIHIGFLIFTGIFTAGILQIPFGRIADKLDRYGKMFQAGTGITVGMFALLAMPFCPDFLAMTLAGVIIGLGSSIAVPALAGIAVEIGKKTGMGTWMGMQNAAHSLGFILTPLVFGITMDCLGIDAVFYLVAFVGLFGGLGSYYYIRRRRKGFKT